MKKIRILLNISCLAFALSALTNLCPAKSYAETNLTGTWLLDGSDLKNLIDPNVPFSNLTIIVEKDTGTGDYTVRSSQPISLSEIGCGSLPTTDIIVRLTPTGDTTFTAKTYFYFPLICTFRYIKSYDLFVKDVAVDGSALTTCKVSKPEDCASWVKEGSNSTPTTAIPAPKVKVLSKSTAKVTITAISGATKYTLQFRKKGSKAITKSIKKTTAVLTGLSSGSSYAIRYQASAPTKSAFSPYTGFKTKK